MGHYYRVVMNYVEHLGTQEWLLVFIAAVAIGAFCMRGFGSRSRY